MEQKTYIKASADDLKLATMLIAPDKRQPRAIVQFVHGMCDHKERYYSFMHFLASHGYVCIIHDQRGHGESVKIKDDLEYMYSGGWKAMIEDIVCK